MMSYNCRFLRSLGALFGQPVLLVQLRVGALKVQQVIFYGEECPDGLGNFIPFRERKPRYSGKNPVVVWEGEAGNIVLIDQQAISAVFESGQVPGVLTVCGYISWKPIHA